MRRRLNLRGRPEAPEEQPIKKLLNADQVAEILQVSKSHAYYLMRCGDIATVRLGRSVRVTEKDLQAYIDGSRQEQQSDWFQRLQVS